MGVFLQKRTPHASQGEAHLLAHLHEHDGEATLAELQRARAHKRSTLTDMIDRLERRGLVRRAPSANDRRSVLVRVTAKGSRLAADIDHELVALEARLQAHAGGRAVRAFAAVAAGEKPGGRFAHEDHLRLAWIVVRQDGLPRGEERVADLLRHLAAALGAPGRYHETVTRTWTRLVAAALPGMSRDANFEQFLTANPALASRDALARHFSPDLLATTEARERWVAPDRAPLTVPPPSHSHSLRRRIGGA